MLPNAWRAERYNYLVRISTINPDGEGIATNDTSSDQIQRDMEESQVGTFLTQEPLFHLHESPFSGEPR